MTIARALVRGAIAAWLLALAPACGPKGMKKIEVPAAGIRIGYALEPGATYAGRLRIGNTQTIEREGVVAGNISQALECDVELRVLGADAQRGGILVQASFDAIELDWSLPASSAISSTEFTRDAVAKLQGMNISFNLLPSGELVYMPVPPAELSGELTHLVEQVLRGLEDAFVVVPAKAVRVGERWRDAQQRGRARELGRRIETTTVAAVDGAYHHEGLDQDVVRVEVDGKRKETTTTEQGVRTRESEGKRVLLFATAGYLAAVEGESRDYDPVDGMSFRRVQLELAQQDRGTPGGPPASQNQTIADPCDPDYVGEAECAEPMPEAPPPPQTQTIADPCDPDYVGEGVCAEAPSEAQPEPPPTEPQP